MTKSTAAKSRGAVLLGSMVRAASRCAFIAVFGLGTSFQAQVATCDASLRPLDGNPNKYDRRGDRCEGLFSADRTGPAEVQVLSFTLLGSRNDHVPNTAVRMVWAPYLGGTARLRAVGLRRRLFYRMDAERPGSEGFYLWPSDVRTALGIKNSEIGLIATTRTNGRDVYLPVALDNKSAGGTCELILHLLSDAISVRTSTGPLLADGSHGRTIKMSTESGSYFPALRPLPLTLEIPGDVGIYWLELSVTFSDGRAAASRILFYSGLPRSLP